MYPNPPDFTTASDNDAWWQVGFPDGSGGLTVTYCYTGGRAFVDMLQSTLGIGVDGRWGSGTSNALVNSLHSVGASSTLIGGVQAEASARRLTNVSLTAAAFYLMRAGGYGGQVPANVTEDHVLVRSTVIPPVWDMAAPPGPSGDILPTCVPTSGPPDQQPAPDQGQPTPDQTQPPPAPPPDQTTGGFGPAVQPQPQQQPNYPAVVPPAGPPAAPQGGIGRGAIVGMAIVGTALVAGIVYIAKSKSPGKITPPLRSPPTLRSSSRAHPNPYYRQRAEWSKSHTHRLGGHAAQSELSRIREKFALSEKQFHAIENALRHGFRLTSRHAGGEGALWHVSMYAPQSGNAAVNRSAGHKLEYAGFREIPAGEFNIIVRRK